SIRCTEDGRTRRTPPKRREAGGLPPPASRCYAALSSALLDVRGLGARGVQREGAGRPLHTAAAAHPRPDHGPAVGRAEGDGSSDGEAGGAGCPDGDIQPGRSGEDALAGAAYGRQGEQRRRGSDAADVRDSGATTGLWRDADAAGERAPAPIG